jgi:uncharacterized hydrophobic protein (TIGR00271 family)
VAAILFHLRVVAPKAIAAQVLEFLASRPSVINIVHFGDAARKPPGDLVLCDVAREDVSLVFATLRELGCETRGSVAAEEVDVVMSRAADDAEAYAEGSPKESVVWEEVEAQTWGSADASFGYALFMVLATLIAAIGIMTDSVVLIIGAMVVGPEYGPLAGVCVAVVERRWALALRSAGALLFGYAVGIVAAGSFTMLVRAVGLAPATITAHQQTLFISRPNAFAAVIALLAGVAGMYSLTTARPGALIGVFISVTTIPAAANIGVAFAYGNRSELHGASLQLAMNISLMILAGLGTLAIQRLAFMRRWRRSLHERRRARRISARGRRDRASG